MSNSDLYLTNSRVIERFASTLVDADDSDAWSKLPLTEDQKHEFIMEQSTDPMVKALHIKIKMLREHIAKKEKEFAEAAEAKKETVEPAAPPQQPKAPEPVDPSTVETD